MTVDDVIDETAKVLPCADKMAFDTQKKAQDTANVAAYQHGAKVKPYLCQHCQLWHLASKYD